MGSLATAEIRGFLQRLSERYSGSAELYLLGGGALCLLGSPRRTLDIDYTVEASPGDSDALTRAIGTLAAEMKLELEAVPIHEFIPLPEGAGKRHRRICSNCARSSIHRNTASRTRRPKARRRTAAGPGWRKKWSTGASGCWRR